jgi:hypothetical protein
MIRIHCQTHRQDPIAHIDRDVDRFLHVYLRGFDPYLTVEPKPPKRRDREQPGGSMPLEGPWVEGHWRGIDTIETWCGRCGGPHPLPLAWLIEIKDSEKDAVLCPCPVVRSPA